MEPNSGSKWWRDSRIPGFPMAMSVSSFLNDLYSRQNWTELTELKGFVDWLFFLSFFCLISLYIYAIVIPPPSHRYSSTVPPLFLLRCSSTPVPPPLFLHPALFLHPCSSTVVPLAGIVQATSLRSAATSRKASSIKGKPALRPSHLILHDSSLGRR